MLDVDNETSHLNQKFIRSKVPKFRIFQYEDVTKNMEEQTFTQFQSFGGQPNGSIVDDGVQYFKKSEHSQN